MGRSCDQTGSKSSCDPSYDQAPDPVVNQITSQVTRCTMLRLTAIRAVMVLYKPQGSAGVPKVVYN
jgi:hypothetical protein